MVTEGTSMDITVTLVEHHVWLVGELLDRAERHEHVLDRPIGPAGTFDGQPTARDLFALLVGQEEMWLDSFDGKPGHEQVDNSLGELRLRHAEAGPRIVDWTRTVIREGNTGKRFRQGTADHPNVFTYGGAIAHLLTFGAHRRALIIGVLQAAGADDLRYGDPMIYFAERAATH
jgi:AraC family transcriptional regulator